MRVQIAALFFRRDISARTHFYQHEKNDGNGGQGKYNDVGWGHNISMRLTQAATLGGMR